MSNIVYPIPDKGPEFNNPVWVALLKESLNHLWDGQGRQPVQKSRYVCFALTAAHLKLFSASPIPEELADLKDLGIHQSLGCIFFEDFLAEKLQLPFWEEADKEDLISLQDARRRWVLQLVEQFGG